MRASLIALLITVQLTTSAVASPVSVYKPYKNHSGSGNYVSYGDFSDIRVLDVRRQNIAYWKLTKGSLSIEQYFKDGHTREIRITDIHNEYLNYVNYRKIKGRLKLVSAIKGPIIKMNFGILDEKAGSKCDLWSSAIAKMNGISLDFQSSVCSQNLEQIIIDPICRTILPPQEYRSLKKAYAADLYLNGGETRATECLKRQETKSILAKAYKIADQDDLQTQIETIGMNYAYNTSLFYSAPEKMAKKITCDWSAEMEPIATTDSTGRTTWHRKKGVDATVIRSDKEFQLGASHELLHGSFVINEKTTQNLVNICYNGANEVTGDSSIEKTDIMSAVKGDVLGGAAHAPSQSTTIAQHQQADATAATKITTDIALTAVPDTVPASDFAPAPAALAQTVIDSGSPAAVASPDYPATYARVAMQQGASAIRSAQGLLSAAGAAVLPLANASTNGLRAPAAVSKPSIYIPPSSASASSASARAGNLAVASADSDFASGSDALPTGNAQKNLKAGRSAAGPEVGSRSLNSTGSAPSTGSVGGTQGAGGFGASGSSSGTSASGGSYTPGQASQTKRRPASVDRKEQQSIMELLNKPTAYRIAKKKLDDKDFVQKLEKNGIVIFKNDGTYKGDPSAAIKYSDKGNRFVREDK